VELDLDSPPRHATTSAPIGQRSRAKNNNNKRNIDNNNINISNIKSNSDSNSNISRAKTARPKTSRRRSSAAAEAAGLATVRLSRINPLNRQTAEDSRPKPTLGRRASVTVPIAAFVEDFRRRRRRSGSSSGRRIRAANTATGRRKSLSFLSDSCRRDSGATSWSSDDSAVFCRSRPFFSDDGGGGHSALMNKRRGMKGRPAMAAAAGAGARRSISTEVSPERGSSSWGFGQPSPRGQAPATDDYGALYERGPSR
jgi:hypothetical protein